MGRQVVPGKMSIFQIVSQKYFQANSQHLRCLFLFLAFFEWHVQEDDDTLPRTPGLAEGWDNQILLMMLWAQAKSSFQSTESMNSTPDLKPCAYAHMLGLSHLFRTFTTYIILQPQTQGSLRKSWKWDDKNCEQVHCRPEIKQDLGHCISLWLLDARSTVSWEMESTKRKLKCMSNQSLASNLRI